MQIYSNKIKTISILRQKAQNPTEINADEIRTWVYKIIVLKKDTLSK
jgi:hypothetical protein